MEVRWAHRGEAPKVYPLVRALAEQDGSAAPRPSAFSRVWAMGFREPAPLRFAVAEEERRIVACMSLHRHVSTWRGQPAVSVEDVFVLPGARGRGIGAALLAFAEQHARDLGAARLELHVLERNEGARRLYERAGWHRTPYLWYQKEVPGPARAAPPARAAQRPGRGPARAARTGRRRGRGPAGWGAPR
jgi:GNAT superfamily N-acetyltransferase